MHLEEEESAEDLYDGWAAEEVMKHKTIQRQGVNFPAAPSNQPIAFSV